MRFILITMLSILLVNNQSFSQNKKDKIEYSGSGIYIVGKTKSGKESFRKPLGKDVMIIYDTFFKSYSIAYIDQNGSLNFIDLEYVGDHSIIYGIKTTKMKDKRGNLFYVIDTINQTHELSWIVPKEYPGGLVGWVVICDVTKDK